MAKDESKLRWALLDFCCLSSVCEGKPTLKWFGFYLQALWGYSGWATSVALAICSYHLLEAYQVLGFLLKALFHVIFPSQEIGTVSSAIKSSFEKCEFVLMGLILGPVWHNMNFMYPLLLQSPWESLGEHRKLHVAELSHRVVHQACACRNMSALVHAWTHTHTHARSKTSTSSVSSPMIRATLAHICLTNFCLISYHPPSTMA